MNIQMTKEQSDWLMKVTSMETTQEAVDYFSSLLRKEGIPASEILTYVRIMMAKTASA